MTREPSAAPKRKLLPDAGERVEAMLTTLNIGRSMRPAVARYPEEAAAMHAQDTMVELIEEALYGD